MYTGILQNDTEGLLKKFEVLSKEEVWMHTS